MNVTIVGGCFPVQHNIPAGRLYHQTLKRLLAERGIEMSVGIIRYERLSNCFGKIAAAAEARRIDLLVFHLRAEPLMRLSKLYYKYVDDAGVFKRSLNLPLLKIVNPEKYEVPMSKKILPHLPCKRESLLHHALREMNYSMGTMVGNRKFAIAEYMILVDAIVGLCREKYIGLLIVGPVSRPFSASENKLSERIDRTFAAAMEKRGVPYLRSLGTYDDEGRYLFFPNGVHVSQAGHYRMAKIMFDKILKHELLPLTFNTFWSGN